MTTQQEEISKEEKVYNLYIELREEELRKKENVKTHNDEIKRIKAEIQDLLDQEKNKKEEVV